MYIIIQSYSPKIKLMVLWFILVYHRVSKPCEYSLSNKAFLIIWIWFGVKQIIGINEKELGQMPLKVYYIIWAILQKEGPIWIDRRN